MSPDSSLIQLVPKRFPLIRNSDELATYNLYACDSGLGTERLQILQYPCVREGCMTTCYFDARYATTETMRQPCNNCLNQQKEVFYLDVGYRTFLEKHSRYIRLMQPLFVQINPRTLQFAFSPQSMRNSLKCQLTNHIANLIVKEMALDENETLNSRIIDFVRVNKHIEGIMKPEVKPKEFLIYSFSKYYPKKTEKGNFREMKLALFFHGKIDPLLVKLTDEKGNPLQQSYKDYLDYGLVAYLGGVQTFFFCIPTSQGTYYYRSSLDLDFREDERVLILHTKPEWKDELSRYGGKLIADQKNSHVFSVGGHDTGKNDSCDYITVFRDVRWSRKSERKQLEITLQKNYTIFKTRVANFNTSTFSSTYRNPLIDNKISLKGTSLLLYYNTHSYQNFKDKNKEVIEKMFFNVGGGVRDAAVFSSGRFSNPRPGVRYIQYRPGTNENPIISESMATTKNQINFPGDDYVMVELPQIKQSGRDNRVMYNNHCLVFGGRRREYDNEGGDMSRVFRAHISRIDKTFRFEKERFRFQNAIPRNLDGFFSLLRESRSEKGEEGIYYIRGTFPLTNPHTYTTFNKHEEQYVTYWVHFIIFEYNLKTSEFSLTPFVTPEGEL